MGIFSLRTLWLRNDRNATILQKKATIYIIKYAEFHDSDLINRDTQESRTGYLKES